MAMEITKKNICVKIKKAPGPMNDFFLKSKGKDVFFRIVFKKTKRN